MIIPQTQYYSFFFLFFPPWFSFCWGGIYVTKSHKITIEWWKCKFTAVYTCVLVTPVTMVLFNLLHHTLNHFPGCLHGSKLITENVFLFARLHWIHHCNVNLYLSIGTALFWTKPKAVFDLLKGPLLRGTLWVSAFVHRYILLRKVFGSQELSLMFNNNSPKLSGHN